MSTSIYNPPAQLYKITHLPSGLAYYGITWAKGKTYLQRFEEHMTAGAKSGIYIKKLLDEGVSRDEFIVKLIGIYPRDEAIRREAELARGSLYPNGLNGNAGDCVIMSEEGKRKIRERRLGSTWSEETKNKMRGSGIRRYESEEARDDARQKVLAYIENNPQVREEISKRNVERFKDPIERNRVSESNKRFIEDHPEDRIRRSENAKRRNEEHPEIIDKMRKACSQVNSGMCVVYDKMTNTTARISKEEYQNNRDRYLNFRSSEYKALKAVL